MGDEILKNFTQIVSDQLRQEDLLCRVGGEEFAVLLPNTAIEQAQQVAERIRASIEEATTTVEYEGSQQALNITASLGVTSVRDQEKSLKSALKRADIGLYEAKENGRNQIIIHME